MRIAHVTASFVFAMLACTAGAQVPRILTSSDSRILARDLEIGMLRDAVPPGIKWDVSIGAGYTDGEDGSETVTTPFDITATVARTGGTRVKLAGAGYTRTELGSSKASGASDVLLQLMQPLPVRIENGAMLASIATTIPTKSDVSAEHSTQSIALYAANKWSGPWETLAALSASRTNVPLPAGISDKAYTAVARLAYVLDANTHEHVRAQFQSTRRSGTRTRNAVAAAYEFTARGTGVAIEVGRGITEGSRDTSVDLSFSWRF